MLHGLFDEYRFLHRYPQQYLTKIAKLFGAIIKNNLLDRVLQDIALKFVIEAFRRDGRRQKFGIIVIKSFFDRLPRFPKFLEDIYQIRQSIQSSEPQMMADIERLYRETKEKEKAQPSQTGTPGRSEAGAELSAAHESTEEPKHSAGPVGDLLDAEAGKQPSEVNPSSTAATNSARTGQPLDQAQARSDKQASGAAQDAKQAANSQHQKDNNKKNSQNQRGNA